MRGALRYNRTPVVFSGAAFDRRSLTIGLPNDLWNRIDQLAQRLDIPRAQAARKLLEVASDPDIIDELLGEDRHAS